MAKNSSDNFRPRKRFGQNFLVDQQIIDKIVSRFAHSRYPVVEIGPGRGALTGELLKLGIPLHALELDRDLIPVLQNQFGHHEHFDLRQGDALKFDFRELYVTEPLRLVGNLPYNIATPLIFRLLEDTSFIADMHFMLQWEVVARLGARCGDKHYGQLSIVVQNLCESTTLFEVPPSAFVPSPKVNSGVIKLAPRATPIVPADMHTEFNTLVKSAFAQRRKTLANNLKGILDEALIREAGVNPGLRAEALDIQQFALLTHAWIKAGGPQKQTPTVRIRSKGH